LRKYRLYSPEPFFDVYNISPRDDRIGLYVDDLLGKHHPAAHGAKQHQDHESRLHAGRSEGLKHSD